MENDLTGLVEQLQIRGSKLIDLYQEMKKLLLDWMKSEDVEGINKILDRREIIFSDIESAHSELDQFQNQVATRMNQKSFSLEILQAEIHPNTFDLILDMYKRLERSISETNKLNQRAVRQFESKKNEILGQIHKLIHAKKVIRPYHDEGIAEPRFFDRKK